MEEEKMNQLQKQNQLLKAILIIFLVIITFIGGFFFSQFYGENLITQDTEKSPQPAEQSAGPGMASPVPQQSKQPQASLMQLSPSPEVDDEQLLKQAFGDKYDRPASDANVSISEKDGNYVKGGVGFEGEMGGGWFLAYFENGEYTIVADGNGTVPCTPVERYNFPTDMVPECYRESDGTLVER